jgi:hypothetical protein
LFCSDEPPDEPVKESSAERVGIIQRFGDSHTIFLKCHCLRRFNETTYQN